MARAHPRHHRVSGRRPAVGNGGRGGGSRAWRLRIRQGGTGQRASTQGERGPRRRLPCMAAAQPPRRSGPAGINPRGTGAEAAAPVHGGCVSAKAKWASGHQPKGNGAEAVVWIRGGRVGGRPGARAAHRSAGRGHLGARGREPRPSGRGHKAHRWAGRVPRRAAPPGRAPLRRSHRCGGRRGRARPSRSRPTPRPAGGGPRAGNRAGRRTRAAQSRRSGRWGT